MFRRVQSHETGVAFLIEQRSTIPEPFQGSFLSGDVVKKPQVSFVRFLGHDAYSACKHCASGYVLSFSLVYILTLFIFLMHLFCMYTIHASHELARQFGRYACMHRTAQRRLGHASAQTVPFIQK